MTTAEGSMKLRGTRPAPRELQILRRMARGLNNAEIGSELDIAEDTVKTFARRLYARLDVRTRTAAVAYAYESGLIEPARASHPAANCCRHCWATMRVLSDGLGEKGIVRRLTTALKYAHYQGPSNGANNPAPPS